MGKDGKKIENPSIKNPNDCHASILAPSNHRKSNQNSYSKTLSIKTTQKEEKEIL